LESSSLRIGASLRSVGRGWYHGRLVVSLVLLVCACGPGASGGDATTSADGPIGLLHLPEGGWRPIELSCDAGDEVSEPYEASEQEAAPCAPVDPNVRYSTDVAPILGSCSGELCHAAWNYASTVGMPSEECCDRRKLVDPGRPDRSYVLQKLRGIELCGNSSEMPPGANVPRAVLDVVESWICLGAPDN
jgi:hypothetical protein